MSASPSPAATGRALVTGANGFVGSHLCRSLIERGYTVRALVRATSNRARLEGLPIEWTVGSLGDLESLRHAVADCDMVFHVAGRVKAPNRDAYFAVNATGTATLVRAARDVAPRMKRFVYVSSQAAAGPSTTDRPRTEDDPPAPISPYGESKLAGEHAVLEAADKLPIAIVRPPAIYGAEDTEILGFFKAVNRRIKPVFAGPTRRLSIAHVADVVAGTILAAEHQRAVGETFFVAEDRTYTWEELEQLIADALGVRAYRLVIPRFMLKSLAAVNEGFGRLFRFTPPLNRDKARDFLQTNWTCSIDKVKTRLGYNARIDFASGAMLTVAWYRAHGWL